MSIVPFDQREGVIWMNGEFVPWKDAKVHVLTHGLHYASAVFEGERAYGGEIFKLTEHTQRLFDSAEMLDMKIPYTVAEIDAACRETLKRQGLYRRLCPPDRLARLGDDGRRRSKREDQCRHRHLAVAGLFRSDAARKGHPPRHRRISPARSADRARPRPRRSAST